MIEDADLRKQLEDGSAALDKSFSRLCDNTYIEQELHTAAVEGRLRILLTEKPEYKAYFTDEQLTQLGIER